MWEVHEWIVGMDKPGVFSNFANIQEAVRFVNNTLFPWSDENMVRIEIIKTEEN